MYCEGNPPARLVHGLADSSMHACMIIHCVCRRLHSFAGVFDDLYVCSVKVTNLRSSHMIQHACLHNNTLCLQPFAGHAPVCSCLHPKMGWFIASAPAVNNPDGCFVIL